jgi:tRNA pseudouridine55 synthase
MHNKVINVYKKAGQTPLDCINTLKKEKEELRFIPMTYAGRLDPLAEGVLLILTGDECHKKDQYLSLPKEYEVDVLFGFATDTYDVMGKVIKNETPPEVLFERFSDYKDIASFPCQFSGPRMREDEGPDHENRHGNFATKIQKILPEFIGRIKQSYPPYSSRTVNGKPLFEWAREGKLDEIEIPTHDVLIENIEIIGSSEILGKVLLEDVKEKISKVKGDFRQKEILKIWEKELDGKESESYPLIKLKITCGSGAYMRIIANDIGKKLGLPSLAFKIVRTKVGKYGIN